MQLGTCPGLVYEDIEKGHSRGTTLQEREGVNSPFPKTTPENSRDPVTKIACMDSTRLSAFDDYSRLADLDRVLLVMASIQIHTPQHTHTHIYKYIYVHVLTIPPLTPYCCAQKRVHGTALKTLPSVILRSFNTTNTHVARSFARQ